MFYIFYMLISGVLPLYTSVFLTKCKLWINKIRY